MKMIASSIVLTFVSVAMAGGPDDRALIAQADANRAPAPAASPAAPNAAQADLDLAERQAAMDSQLSQIRLETIRARRALQNGQPEEAARRAEHVLELARELPRDVDASPYELQAEGILARTGHAASRQARSPDLADVDQNGLWRLPHDVSTSPRPARVDVTVGMASHQALSDLYPAGPADGPDAHLSANGDVRYPADWRERVARRSAHAGGEVARSPSWTDDKGREWYAAMYDITDITETPPDFSYPYGFDPMLDYNNAMDRAALRNRSWIFGGDARELAAGLPLLRAFGPVGDPIYNARYERDRAAREREVVQMIQGLTGQEKDSRIIVIPGPGN